MRRRTACLTGLLLVATSAPLKAEEPKSPLAVFERVAERYIHAFDAGDEATLAAIVGEKQDDPWKIQLDPWLLTEEICHQGRYDAALAYARASPHVVSRDLPAYVESRRKLKLDGDLHARLLAVVTAAPGSAVAATGRPTDLSTVYGVLLEAGRAGHLEHARRPEEALAAYERAGQAAEKLRWIGRAELCLSSAARCALALGDRARAVQALLKAAELARRVHNRAGLATTLADLGRLQLDAGQLEGALASLGEACALAEALGGWGELAHLWPQLADVLGKLGKLDEEYEVLRKFTRLAAGRKDEAGVLEGLIAVGKVCVLRGRWAEAQAVFEAGLRREPPDRARLRLLMALADLYETLGNAEGAVRCYDAALAVADRLDDDALRATLQFHVGKFMLRLGRLHDALEHARSALRAYEEQKREGDAAHALNILGLAQQALGHPEEARRTFERALQASERAAPDLTLGLRVNLAVLTALGGKPAEAAKELEQVLKRLDARPSQEQRAAALRALTNVRLELGDPAGALESARRGLEVELALRARLADRQATIARGASRPLAELAIKTAASLGRVEDLFHFVECLRSDGLLTWLHTQESLGSFGISPELESKLMAARHAVWFAESTYREAIKAQDANAIKGAGQELNRAHFFLREVMETWERAARLTAKGKPPTMISLAATRAMLAPDEALVQFALLRDRALAVVVRRDDARIVSLATAPAEIGRLGKDLDNSLGVTDGRGREEKKKPTIGALANARARRLAAALLDPLKLKADVRRVLVVPDGVTGRLPLALFGSAKRSFVYVPSATIYERLREQRAERGVDVLALGDPLYEDLDPDRALSQGVNERLFKALPGTRREARAVGDVHLLGADATEPYLMYMLGRQQRWRSILFACHGLNDVDHPALSALALAPSTSNDGLLMATEVEKLHFDTDLVVLSACETARGQGNAAGGIPGLRRSLMMAGVPRVIGSLWKVDDEATSELMVKFYELWNPKEGTGLSTAEALQRAVEHVRLKERWSHPNFWAAWVLWGVPD